MEEKMLNTPKKLPGGLLTFSDIRRQKCIYVDKTSYLYDIVREKDPFFLSRPRRFGKSLLVSTLKEIFLGHKELFKGLDIYDSGFESKICLYIG
jgi:hypothetical protein